MHRQRKNFEVCIVFCCFLDVCPLNVCPSVQYFFIAGLGNGPTITRIFNPKHGPEGLCPLTGPVRSHWETGFISQRRLRWTRLWDL
mmetsp:Transcript_73901/g.196868  ORF Transcript_73901/g.196868 Transcript_73901/m.196868 type:complete len:86 (+) Transcript_73901:892-1149(+)